VLAKAARAKPRDIAEKLKAELAREPGFVKLDVAGPGFLNITLAPSVWQGMVTSILKEGGAYGRSTLGGGEAINVEYVSANPTGPMHVGHCRGAVFGDALANLLAFAGYKVTREYYINDAGAQVDVLARSAYLRYREALGEDIGEIPQGLYPGEYLKPVGEGLAKAFGRSLLDKPESEWLPDVRAVAIGDMLAQIQEDLAALNIRQEVFFSERSLTAGNRDEVAVTVAELRAKGLVYEGRLEKPKGHDADEWEDREQTLFKATEFGDDVDRALLKSDGSYTYFASDMAYHHNKLERGFKHLINVFGADHSGYIKRMKAAVAALSDGKADLDIKVCQLVRLLRAGEPVKMSKRAGTFVTLREVVDEVGRDPVRFMMLYRKNDATLDFDLAKVIEQSKDNAVFYVQYAHARAHSVFRNVRETFADLDAMGAEVAAADVSVLTDPAELDLIKRLALFPRLVEGAAAAHEPHRLAFYLNDLAASFHSLWTRGNESPHLRFIQPGDRKLTAARLALMRSCAQVVTSGLGILGVHAPSEMR
jgi:arginyl-tRNA synthetase